MYSSDEEEMLIVVLDDDDDLVVGKSKNNIPVSHQKLPQRSSNVGSPYTPRHSSVPHHRKSPNRSKPRDWETSSFGGGYNKSRHRNQVSKDQRCQTFQQQADSRTYQRPVINAQKIAQRLNNIKQDQHKQSSRAGSPRSEKTTPDRSFESNNLQNFISNSEKPHAVIAKPVERRRKKRRPRPEPEGAPLDYADMDEFDKLIYNDEPIFSDYGTDEDNSHEKGSKPQRRPGFSIAAFTIGLGLNSNTMIKYTIIGTELQNIIRVSLKMVRNLRSHT